MASAIAAKEAPSYSSSRVQRAARLNNVEATKLLQQLQLLDKAKQHQCRLTNQDIRLVSMSIDYIQANSGNSQEGWRPPSVASDRGTEEERSGEEGDERLEGPCFLYGERIISRKIRRLNRPMSAMERLSSSQHGGRNATGLSDADDHDDYNDDVRLPRPRSCCSMTSSKITGNSRPYSVMSWFKHADSPNVDETDHHSPVHTPRSGFNFFSHSSRPGSAMSSTTSGCAREPWEDDTTEITKKIIKSQARAQSGKRESVYQSGSSVMNAQSSKKVRDLARKIRISATKFSLDGVDPSMRQPPSEMSAADKPPKKPNIAKDFLGRRATVGDILNQQRPTMSAGGWKQHLSRNGQHKPISTTAQQTARLDAKKRFNEARRAEVVERVKHFVNKKKS